MSDSHKWNLFLSLAIYIPALPAKCSYIFSADFKPQEIISYLRCLTKNGFSRQFSV